MTDDQIISTVQAIIVEAKSDTVLIHADEVRLDAQIRELPLAMDSIDYVRMIIGIEEAFGFIAEDDDFLASSVQTVGDVIERVRHRLQQAKG